MSATSTLTIVLEQDLDDERAQLVADAISMIRGVLHTATKEVDDEAAYVAEVRIKDRLRRNLLQLIREELV